MGEQITTQKPGEGQVQETEKEKMRRKIAKDLAVVEQLLSRPLLPPMPPGLLDPFKPPEAPPPAPAEPPEPEEPDPVETVQETVCAIQDGTVDVKGLSQRRRQECVGYLTAQGFGGGDIARLLKITERTVRRDRAGWRKREMVTPNRVTQQEYLGEMEAMMRGSIERLLRLARDGQTPPYARLWAEEAVVRVYRQWMETARRVWRG